MSDLYGSPTVTVNPIRAMHVLVYYRILTLNYSSYKKCHTYSRSSLMCVFVLNISLQICEKVSSSKFYSRL